jgi:hypothetical protein
MSARTCKKETGLSPVVYRKLENVFKELQTLFPATPSCAIVNAQGELLYPSPPQFVPLACSLVYSLVYLFLLLITKLIKYLNYKNAK